MQQGPNRSRLKIAFIGGRGVIGTYSGIETYYEEVGSRLVDRGHEVTAYCRSYFTPRVSQYRGLQIRHLPALRAKHLETLSHSFLASLHSLFRPFDIIQFHAIGSASLALIPRLFGRLTVVSVRGLDWQRAKWKGFARTVLQMSEWASARFPTATVVVSETLASHYERVHGSRPFVIRNAIGSAPRKTIDRLQEHGLEKDDFILFAGRISPEKGVHTLLEALRPLGAKKKLVLAGGSSYSQAYIDEVRQAAWDGVIFLGRVDQATMRELYSNCYVFVLPSDMEGLSIALLEALSYGNCILTTDIPENVEVIGNAGLTFPPGNADSLRQVLRKVLDSPGVVKDLRSLARERAKGWPTWDDVADETETLYLRLLQDSRRRPPEPGATVR